MSTSPKRSEVWLVDLGMTAKVRPCLVLSIPADQQEDRVLTTVVPHTTSVRNFRFEVPGNAKLLKSGVFNVQGIVTIPTVKLIRRLGLLDANQMQEVEAAIRLWLGLREAP